MHFYSAGTTVHAVPAYHLWSGICWGGKQQALQVVSAGGSQVPGDTATHPRSGLASCIPEFRLAGRMDGWVDLTMRWITKTTRLRGVCSTFRKIAGMDFLNIWNMNMKYFLGHSLTILSVKHLWKHCPTALFHNTAGNLVTLAVWAGRSVKQLTDIRSSFFSLPPNPQPKNSFLVDMKLFSI